MKPRRMSPHGIGPGYGVVQWDSSIEYLMNYLDVNNYNKDSLYGQLECLIVQCEESGKETDSATYWNYEIETMTRIFLWAFEKPSDPHENNRIEYAQKWYNYFNT